jgi:hypothetical protein
LNTQIIGKAALLVQNTTSNPLKEFILTLNPGLDITSVQGAKYSRERQIIKIEPQNSLQAGDSLNIVIDYKGTIDNKYIYQDFNLLNYESSDLVVFNKFLYLENIDYDDFEYSIYVPEEMFVSKTKPIPNAEGGNDFPAEYQNENGEIIPFIPKSVDLSMSEIEKTLYQISYNLKDNNLLAYFTDTWENLKLSKIYGYILLTITGGIIIFLFKVMNK